jgi:phosphohistidine phosphatase
MRLLIIRHAIAVPHGTEGIPDDERPLTPRGRKRFRQAARGLARAATRPDVLLTSPLPRARETADIAAEAWGKVKPLEAEALAGGGVEEIAAELDKHAKAGTVAIVGHEPDLSSFLAYLLGTRASERLTFRKGGVACVDVPGPVGNGGTLTWYLPPRILRTIGDAR